MEVRGQRECKACGTQWSYYETGSPACPECGSLYSVGISERRLHIDRPADLELEPAISALAAERYREAGDAADETARRYVRRRGFVHAGDLRPLEDAYLAAAEIRHVAHELRRVTPARPGGGQFDPPYVRVLFEAAEEESWPPAEAVPDVMAGPRGLGVADAVGDYHDAMKRWVDETEPGVTIVGRLDRLDSHVRRLDALDGSIDPGTADQVVAAARAIGEYLRTGSGEKRVDQALESLR